MSLNRRDFGALALAALGPGAKYDGVRLGIGAYSFRGLQMEEIIRILAAAKVTALEMESAFVDSPSEAAALRERLQHAGVKVYAYSHPIDASATDEQIDRVMLITKALGSPILNTATTMTVAKRLVSFAEKHKLMVGLHPNGKTDDPESIGSGASYLKAFEFSPRIGANPDLYLFRNWGPDPIAFLKQIHRRITTLHFHDRKGSTWVPFGEGDLPAQEILLLAQREHYSFTFTIERIYTFPGLDQLTEIRKSLDYCRRVLGSGL